MPDPLWFGPPESVAALLESSDPSTVVANIAAWLSEAVSHELSMGYRWPTSSRPWRRGSVSAAQPRR
ncbi:hypothetical protein I553_8773 [Mycobacterium xenopi 4042]|uniref:Uncharacterized protein n=1 Tax=Mycobacterium xenopi 4042 TaxID=1299334 RepID=X8CKU0_MYCXE|nr:hypothetical protein I553_8773 [Mycobacterium xenopi 4042]